MGLLRFFEATENAEVIEDAEIMIGTKKSEALWLGLALVAHAGNECLEVGCFVVGDGCLIVDVVILEYLREHVGNGLALRVAHGIDSSVGTFSHQLVLQPIALAVAANDATCLPEADVV